MKKNHIAVIAILAVVFAGLASPTYAVLIGNDVSVGRGNASDGATTVFQLYPNAPITASGYVDAFAIFDQDGNSGFSGHAYVLRPTGGNNYLVLKDTAIAGTGTDLTKYFPTTPLYVLPGDLIAHYGTSVPYTDGPLGGSFQQIFYSSPNAPILGNTITLPSAAFPQSAADGPNFGGVFIRDYAFAANYIVPEPSSAILVFLGAIGLLRYRRRAL